MMELILDTRVLYHGYLKHNCVSWLYTILLHTEANRSGSPQSFEGIRTENVSHSQKLCNVNFGWGKSGHISIYDENVRVLYLLLFINYYLYSSWTCWITWGNSPSSPRYTRLVLGKSRDWDFYLRLFYKPDREIITSTCKIVGAIFLYGLLR